MSISLAAVFNVEILKAAAIFDSEGFLSCPYDKPFPYLGEMKAFASDNAAAKRLKISPAREIAVLK